MANGDGKCVGLLVKKHSAGENGVSVLELFIEGCSNCSVFA